MSNVTLYDLMSMYGDVEAIVYDEDNYSSQEAAEAVNDEIALSGGTETTSARAIRRARQKLKKTLGSIDEMSGLHPINREELNKKPVGRDKNVATWSPKLEYDSEGGDFVTPPELVSSSGSREVDPDDQEILDKFGLNADSWEVTSLRRSTWQSQSGEWLESFRGSFKKRSLGSGRFTQEEVDRYLTAYPSFIPPVPEPDHKTILVPIGDTQLGKPDGGGSKGTIERFAATTAQIKARIEAEKKPVRLILAWLGDCLEGLVSQGGRNVARLDLSITEQVRVYRRLLFHQIAQLAPLASSVLVVVVGGNHDEAFRDQTMSPLDSWALEGASAVADMLSQDRERYGHVQFKFPEDEELGVTVNVMTEENPYVIHFEHGHSARNPNKIKDWWANQSFGRQSSASADMLLTGHWHHMRVEHMGGGRLWMQVPSMDGGSDWFRRKSGEEAPPGQLSMEIVGGVEGFRRLEFHPGYVLTR